LAEAGAARAFGLAEAAVAAPCGNRVEAIIKDGAEHFAGHRPLARIDPRQRRARVGDLLACLGERCQPVERARRQHHHFDAFGRGETRQFRRAPLSPVGRGERRRRRPG